MKSARRSPWKPIPGYEGYYSVSRSGKVRRDKPARNSFVGRILQADIRPNGYPYVELHKNGEARKHSLHTLVAAAYLGPPLDGQEVRHLDGDRSNCSLSNLAYGTHLDNAQDMVAHGRSSAGEKHHDAKLSDSLVLEMRRLYALGYASGQLASMFNVSRTTAWQAASGKTWTHIGGFK